MKVTLDFGDTPSLCLAFGLRLVRGVRNGPSPEWLQKRLRAIGLRPINALVDITNFITFDRNRPLHVFDAAKVKGDLVVRRARDGEELLALDGRTYTLDPSMCVIADDNGVESLAGVIGGEVSGCSETTTDVLIEAALWEPLNIAQTGRKLGINTDARYRNERGIDPAFNMPGLELATRMVIELCGGTPERGVPRRRNPAADGHHRIPDDRGEAHRRHRSVDGRGERNLRRARLHVEAASHQGHAVGHRAVMAAGDRHQGRSRGGGRAHHRRRPRPVRAARREPGASEPLLTLLQNRTRRAKRALAARGLVEAVTWSFIAHGAAAAFGGGGEANSSSPTRSPPTCRTCGRACCPASPPRPSATPIAASPISPCSRSVRSMPANGREDQTTAVAAMRRGTAGVNGSGRHWSGKAAPVSVFDVKADALAVLDTLGLSPDKVQVTADAPAWYHPGRSGTIRQGPKTVIGSFGELHPKVLEVLDADGPLAGFELILEAIPAPRAKPTKTRAVLALSDFQPVRRDFAFVVDRDVTAAAIVRAASGADRKLVAGVSVFDLFEGAAIGEGRKSVAIEVTLQPTEHTLTDQEIEAVAAKVVAEVAKATGGTLRS